jgi:hypothetical protein
MTLLPQEQQAGRALDALVAQEVMGWDVRSDGRGEYRVARKRNKSGNARGIQLEQLPHYSSNMIGAWLVVEKVSALVSLEVIFALYLHERGEWEADFGMERVGLGETAPLAICRAALLAIASRDTALSSSSQEKKA